MRHSDPKKFVIKINKGIPLFVFRVILKSIYACKIKVKIYFRTYTHVQAYNKKLLVCYFFPYPFSSYIVSYTHLYRYYMVAVFVYKILDTYNHEYFLSHRDASLIFKVQC